VIAVGAFYFLSPKDCGADCEQGSQNSVKGESQEQITLKPTEMLLEKVKTVSPEEFKTELEEEVVLIDVRTPAEFAQGHIEGAVNADFYDSENFENYLYELDRDQKYMIYCRSGNRSGQTLQVMKDKGFAEVTNLDGGISLWMAENFTVE